MDKKYIDSITSLKGIFIIVIVLYHVNTQFGNVFSDKLYFVYEYGGLIGNCCFFMLSGFLLTLNNKEMIRNGNITFMQYILKHIWKIYPLYFFSNMCQLLINIYDYGFLQSFNVAEFLKVALMITSGWIDDFYPYNYPTWFISVLLICYILYYFLTKSSKKDSDFYYVFILLLLIWGQILLQNSWSIPFCYAHNGQGIFNFTLGIVLCEMYIWLEGHKYYYKYITTISIGAFAALVIGTFIWGLYAFIGNLSFVYSLLVCPLIIYFSIRIKIIRKVLSAAPLVRLGKISMSIFMWHVPIAGFLRIITSKYVDDIANYQEAYFIVYFVIIIIWSIVSSRLDARFHNYVNIS